LLILLSITNSLPTANPPPSEASKIAVWAISFGVPRRSSGILLTSSSSIGIPFCQIVAGVDRH
jgi:hypothetical protein